MRQVISNITALPLFKGSSRITIGSVHLLRQVRIENPSSRLTRIILNRSLFNKSSQDPVTRQELETTPGNQSGDGISKIKSDLISLRTSDSALPSKILETAFTTLTTIIILGIGFGTGGYAYHNFYKWLVLEKIDNAFMPGDPALDTAWLNNSKDQPGAEDHWILRDEQDKINAIVNGNITGHYHLLLGEKGTGKSSMLLDAMRNINSDGCSMLEAHADLEIFRVRLGKTIDFEFNEDYIGSYFSERGPRDSTPILDIERAFNKLEKVAIRRKKSGNGPLVLIINSVHFLRDDHDGQDLIELLQQRAEKWAANNLVTMIFSSDEYWVYEKFKQFATRMEVTAISDLPKSRALSALEKYRQKYFNQTPSDSMLEEVFERIGGRLIFLNRVARAEDMLEECNQIIEIERRWFLNKAWILGAEMDDDVMDQQKYASAAMVLAQALVDAEDGSSEALSKNGGLPEIPLHIARQIMTRCDFIRDYDHKNLFTITPTAMVRADSVPMQRAFRIICREPGFKDHLEKTIQRISDIESLGRTREIVAKDLALGSRYKVSRIDTTSKNMNHWELSIEDKDASKNQ